MAETLSVQGKAGDWSFSFRVPAEVVAGDASVLDHSDLQVWHQGQSVSTTGHKLEFARGAWGYTLTIQANPGERRLTVFNHTSPGELWFPTAPEVLRFRPGWYRFDGGHTLGVGGVEANLRIEGESESAAPERRASSFVVLLAGLLAGAWITGSAGRPHNAVQAFAEPGVSPGHGD